MEIYLLRHAIAEDRDDAKYPDDSRRPLSAEGAAKMRRIARGMRRLELEFDLIVASPYERARQTAQIVAVTFKAKKRLHFSAHLTPGGNPRELIRELSKRALPHSARSVLLVGHEPDLSGLLSVWLAGHNDMRLLLKKGGLCKLTAETVRYSLCAQLEWMLGPRQLVLIGQA